MKKNIITVIFFTLIAMSCNESKQVEQKSFKLVTLDPGHFHAALVQKTMYADIDSTVQVYAPKGSDLQLHLDRINSYNNRKENPTHWNEQVYTGDDFFEQMVAQKKGNLVILSGNNQKKTDYILTSLQNGFDVLADKPMVIDANGFNKLKQAFSVAAKNKLLLYDIMTERFEINTILQKELSMMPDIFGSLEKGSIDNPAITKESVHHFYKFVSGTVLTRPAWFLDVSQQGEGIVDVMTHLVDLVQWECFPETVIDYTKDIDVLKARRWGTPVTLSQFSAITKLNAFPSFLQPVVTDSVVKVFSNGEINYTIKGVHAKTSVIWNYKAPEGTGDTHYSIMRGTKTNLIIRQGKEENYQPLLYIEPTGKDADYQAVLSTAIQKLSAKYPGIELIKSTKGWALKIPESLKEGHEAHFARVTENYLNYLKHNNMPSWEVPNMLAKYYTTTMGLALALKNSQ
jgi:predicted dehydrogenase